VTLRIAAAAALILGLTTLLLYLHGIGKGPWADPAARNLRRMKERTWPPAATEPFTIAAMTALPRWAGLSVYAPIERRGVAVEGYVQRMVRAGDDDIHLDFAPETRGSEGPLVPFLSAEITPAWHRGSTAWRYPRLVEALRPIFGGVTQWDQPPRRVRLSGWLMYDYPFEGSPPKGGFPRHVSFWEIHPVTGVELWDDSLARFVEYPR